MAVRASRVRVGLTPTPLNTVDTSGTPGSGLLARNMSTTTYVYIGGNDVNLTVGYPLPPGGEVSVEFESAAEIMYAIADGAEVEMAVLRAGV